MHGLGKDLQGLGDVLHNAGSYRVGGGASNSIPAPQPLISEDPVYPR